MCSKIRFADTSPTCASLSQTQMHWEVWCRGPCIAVDKVAKLKLGLSFGTVRGSRSKGWWMWGWGERAVLMRDYFPDVSHTSEKKTTQCIFTGDRGTRADLPSS